MKNLIQQLKSLFTSKAQKEKERAELARKEQEEKKRLRQEAKSAPEKQKIKKEVSPKAKFKVGDRVKIVEQGSANTHGFLIGRIVTIEVVYDHTDRISYWAVNDNGAGGTVYEWHIEKVR